jgi:hypothetical protein
MIARDIACSLLKGAVAHAAGDVRQDIEDALEQSHTVTSSPMFGKYSVI